MDIKTILEEYEEELEWSRMQWEDDYYYHLNRLIEAGEII